MGLDERLELHKNEHEASCIGIAFGIINKSIFTNIFHYIFAVIDLFIFALYSGSPFLPQEHKSKIQNRIKVNFFII